VVFENSVLERTEGKPGENEELVTGTPLENVIWVFKSSSVI
jgi:hypothetical protein